MAPLSMIKSVINPNKRTGAKKNLLKRNDITSDGFNEDDESSSLSGRQENRKSKSKKRFSAIKFLRRKNTKHGAEEAGDGYESDASTGSTRSTSSSFLRYQNRAIWRAKLMKKSVLQRFGDGSEQPVQDETKWPMFDRIYKRQNQVKKGQVGDDEDLEYDDDSVSSAESGDGCNLGPPAPIINIELEEEDICEGLGLKQPSSRDGTAEIVTNVESHEREAQQYDPDGTLEIAAEEESQGNMVTPEKTSEEREVDGDGLASYAAASDNESGASQEDIKGSVESTSEVSVQGSSESKRQKSSGVCSPTSVQESSMHIAIEEVSADGVERLALEEVQSCEGRSESKSPSLASDSGASTIQTSGIPTSESPKKEPAASSATPPARQSKQQSVSPSPQMFPTQKLNQRSQLNITLNENKRKPVSANEGKKRNSLDDKHKDIAPRLSETSKNETESSLTAKDGAWRNTPKAQKKLPSQRINQSTKQNDTPKQKKQKPSSAKKGRKKISFDDNREDIIPRSIPKTISYSLMSAIGDGSARQRNSHSLMERRPLQPNGSHLDTSYWSHRGRRNYMEDRFVIEHIGSMNKNTENSKPISLIAVFDGHGGSAASQFCSDWISSYIRKRNEHFPENLGLAMKTAFTKVDSDFVGSGHFDGTTACACAVVGKKVICCNAGDSRAIIVKRDGSAVDLSKDHKPDRDDETKRINDLGGRVIHWGRWRVEGVLAVSRSIGDAKLKPYVTAEPDTVEHEIDEDDMFLVVASDGVWDTMTSDLVAKFVLVNTCKIVNKTLQVDDILLRWIARQVSKRARENGSSDNISCIVANLKSCN